MNNDTERAKKLLKSENYTCVLCKENLIYTSSDRGIKPLIDFIDKGTDLNDFSAADKIVGKAAAFLYVILGVKEIYADVMSESAVQLLEQHNIPTAYDVLTKEIINRKGTGICPMEETVSEITNPHEALVALKEKIKELQMNDR